MTAVAERVLGKGYVSFEWGGGVIGANQLDLTFHKDAYNLAVRDHRHR